MKKLFTLSFLILLLASPFLSLTQAQSTQIYWGAWVSDATDGHIGSYSYLSTFESQVGKAVSIWDWIQLWNRPADGDNQPTFQTAQMNQARNNGIIPLISWSPEQNVGTPSSTPGDFYNLQSILDGNFDAYFAAWGAASASWGHPYFLRPMWEFTGYWTSQDLGGYGIYPFDGGNGNTAAMFVSAWQYMVSHVRAAGGNQITWVWCPGNVGDSQAVLESVYPGDNYVDWVGTDVYPGTGESFTSNAGTELTNIQAVSSKPIMIPELGYTGSNSAAWWTTFFSTIPSYIKAVVIWEMPSVMSLTVVSPSGTLAAFSSGIGSSYFSSNTFSSISATPILPLGEVSPTPTPSPSPTPFTNPTTLPTPTPHTSSNPTATNTNSQTQYTQTINVNSIDLNLSLGDWLIFSSIALLLIGILAISIKKR